MCAKSCQKKKKKQDDPSLTTDSKTDDPPLSALAQPASPNTFLPVPTFKMAACSTAALLINKHAH